MSGPFAAVRATETTDLEDFGAEPIWLVVVKVLAVFAFLMVMVLFAIVFERKVVGRMQTRIGPNRTGPWGTLQSLADAVKLGFKEDIMPALADKPVYFLAPILSVVPAFLAFAVIPFGPTVSIAGHHTPLQLTDLPVGVLLVFATSALGVYGIILSGWASGSTYPMLGSLRSAAQVISYEVAMGLSLVAVFLYAESISTSEVVAAQDDLWFGIPLIVSFLIYAVAVVGETNRAPFDLPEAESELVGGFHTEYSSMKFAMFYLAEYINMITVSALATTLFLGGWRAPWPLSLWDGANAGWWPLLWFVAKVVLGMFMFIWLRGTLPRMRYDQFMQFGWKILIPINLVWIMIVAAFQVMRDRGWETNELLFIIGIPLVIVLVALTFWPERRRAPEPPADEGEPAFPIPPMDLVVPPSPRVEVTVGGVPQGESDVDTGTGGAAPPGRERARPTGRPTTSRTGRRPHRPGGGSSEGTDPGKTDV